MMRLLVRIVTASLLFSGCNQQTADHAPLQLRTIDNTEVRVVPVEAPPQLAEQASVLKTDTAAPAGKRAPKLKTKAGTSSQPTPTPTPTTELPFAPLIAMDPVDGGKVSIRVETPTMEYKNRIYYFTSAENKKAFGADPERYLKGQLARY